MSAKNSKENPKGKFRTENTVAKIKSSVDGSNNKTKGTEGRIRECEDEKK